MSSLVKLKIYAYSDSGFSSSEGSPFEASINPDSYTHNHAVNFSETENLAEGEGNAPQFNCLDTETVDFTMYLDGTGISGLLTSVSDQVTALKDVVYCFNGESHRTNYLKLSWGSMVFYCNLTKLNINYTMFSMDGDPLRAKVDLSFAGFTDAKLMTAKANKSSPDMSHLKKMGTTDSIPLFCNKIYKKSDLYMEVAKANNLDTFRHIKVGTTLMFPQLNQ